MATYKLRLENAQQVQLLTHHINERMSDVIVKPDAHDASNPGGPHYVEVNYSGDPAHQKQLEEAMHHGFSEMGHQDWRTRFDVKHW